jgi:hypothetical protein
MLSISEHYLNWIYQDSVLELIQEPLPPETKKLSLKEKISIGVERGANCFCQSIHLFCFMTGVETLLRKTTPDNNDGILLNAFLVPIIEECFFRGLLRKGVEKTQSLYLQDTATDSAKKFRIVFLNAAFSFVHSGWRRRILFLHYPLESKLREETGSIIPPIMSHITQNLILFSALKIATVLKKCNEGKSD